MIKKLKVESNGDNDTHPASQIFAFENLMGKSGNYIKALNEKVTNWERMKF